MDLSGLEFGSLAGKLDSTLGNYYVNNIYLTGLSTVIVKLHMSDRPELSLLLAPRIGAWVTRSELPRAPADRFVSELRARLERAKFSSARALEGERILVLEFSRQDGALSIVGEFFGAGNVILLDASSTVLACMNTLDVSDRSVRPGIKYLPPRARSLAPGRASREDLSKMLASEEPVERLVGRGVSLPRRIIDEALVRSGIAKGKKGSSLSPSEVGSLADSLSSVVAESLSGGPAYAYFREGVPVEVSSVRLRLAEPLLEKPYPSILEAMDELFTPRVLEGLAEESLKAEHDDLKKLQSSISSKKAELESLQRRAASLKEVASSLMAGTCDYGSAAAALKPISSYRYDGGSRTWSSGARSLRVDSPFSLASQIFSDAKDTEAASSKLSEALARLEKRRQELSSSIDVERGTRAMARPRRERKWFEKFRWFYTSEGFFAIGGRDAGSNSVLVRKHMEASDLVFHTEMPGSAFFVLKGGQAAGERSLREVAEATVSYSRAWREGLISADSYCVEPAQVLRGAPSGQYLPKGSFVVEGERRYFKGIELSISIGVGTLDGQPFLFGGPASALVERCQLVIELVPGHLSAPEAAKKVKRELSSHLQGEAKAFVDSLHIDELVRALPTGRLRQLRMLKGKTALQGVGASRSPVEENR